MNALVVRVGRPQRPLPVTQRLPICGATPFFGFRVPARLLQRRQREHRSVRTAALGFGRCLL